MKLLLISALCLPLVSGAAELTIPEEPAFTGTGPAAARAIAGGTAAQAGFTGMGVPVP